MAHAHAGAGLPPDQDPAAGTACARTSSTPSSSTAISSTSASISGGAEGATFLPLAVDPAEPLRLAASFSPAILCGAGAPTADAAAALTVAQVQVAVCRLWRLPRFGPRTLCILSRTATGRREVVGRLGHGHGASCLQRATSTATRRCRRWAGRARPDAALPAPLFSCALPAPVFVRPPAALPLAPPTRAGQAALR